MGSIGPLRSSSLIVVALAPVRLVVAGFSSIMGDMAKGVKSVPEGPSQTTMSQGRRQGKTLLT